MLLQQEGIRKKNIIIYSVKDIHRSGNFSRGGGGRGGGRARMAACLEIEGG